MKMQPVLFAGITVGLAIGMSQWQMVQATIMPGRLSGLMIPMGETAAVSMAKPVSMVKPAMAKPAMAKTEMAKTEMAKTEMAKVLMAGSFVKAEHPTMGGASVVMKDGKQYLMFDQQFKSDEGPDLYVLLHREAMPKQYGEADYVSLGRLQQVNGAQVYEIPAGVKVEEFKSAVIWCKQFSATFGFAMLK
jgi:Electron transfer DM13